MHRLSVLSYKCHPAFLHGQQKGLQILLILHPDALSACISVSPLDKAFTVAQQSEPPLLFLLYHKILELEHLYKKKLENMHILTVIHTKCLNTQKCQVQIYLGKY